MLSSQQTYVVVIIQIYMAMNHSKRSYSKKNQGVVDFLYMR